MSTFALLASGLPVVLGALAIGVCFGVALHLHSRAIRAQHERMSEQWCEKHRTGDA